MVNSHEGALEFVKMYIAGVTASHSNSEHALEQFIVLLKLKSTF